MAEQTKFEAVDAATVAALLGKTPKSINNYINLRGLPSTGEGRRRSFSWPDVLEWYVDYRISLLHGDGSDGNGEGENEPQVSDSGPRKKEDIRAANLRKTRAEADLKELDLGRKNGEVIVIADATARLNRMMGNLRAKLLALPPKLANRIEGERERTGREALIKEEIENLCRDISSGAIVGVTIDDAPPDQEPDAALE